jgi:hypothetical protein
LLEIDEPDLMGIRPGIKHWRGEGSFENAEGMLELLGSLEECCIVKDGLRSSNL